MIDLQKLLHILIIKLQINLPEDFGGIKDFLDKISEEPEFKKSNLKKRDLRAFLWIQIHKDKKLNPKSFILSTHKKNSGNSIYHINAVLVEVLSELDIPIIDIYEIIVHMITELGHDGTASVLLKTIQKLAQNEEKGVCLLSLTIKNSDSIQKNIAANILLGLEKTNPSLAYQRASELLELDDFRNEAVYTFAYFNFLSEEDFHSIFNVITSYQVDDDIFTHQLIVFLARSFTNLYANDHTRETAYNLLKEIAQKSVEFQKSIVWEFRYLQGFDQLKSGILLSISLKDQNLQKDIDLILDDFKEVKQSFMILRKIMLNSGAYFKAANFYSLCEIEQKKSKGIFKMPD